MGDRKFYGAIWEARQKVHDELLRAERPAEVERNRDPEARAGEAPQIDQYVTEIDLVELQNEQFRERVLAELKDGKITRHDALYEIRRFENDLSRNGEYRSLQSRHERPEERKLSFASDRKLQARLPPEQSQSSEGEKKLTFKKDIENDHSWDR